MKGKWRVAILGLGHWYSAYNLARALREYPKAELAAVAWHNSAQLAAFTNDFQIQGYHDYGELLKREDIDLVHIATPVSEMADCAIRAARAGKHIVLGKPMAMTMEEADQMVEAVETSGVKCVAFQGTKRLRSGDLKARIEAGEIGEIILEVIGARGEIIDDGLRVPGRAVLAAGASGWIFEREAGELFGPPAPFPLDHLIECVENDRQSAASIQEARKSFRVALAAYQSARAGRPISLQW